MNARTVTPSSPDDMPIWARLRLHVAHIRFEDVTAWVQISPLLGHAHTETSLVVLSRERELR